MQLQGPRETDWSRYYCNQPSVAYDTSANHSLFDSELKSNSVRLGSNSNPYCSIWKDAESTRVQSCNTLSFAMDARIRLDNLKSGCNSLLDRPLYNYNNQKDLRDSEPKEEVSALDSVELIDVEDDVQDEESWLYESPKKQVCADKNQSALRWCRHVLDNPSPEMEAARQMLINRLDQRSNSSFYRPPTFFHHTGAAAVGSSIDRTSANAAQSNSDNNKLSIFHDSITTNYRLQDITDVHIMACLQEASLRQDYVSTPAAASPRRSPEPSFHFNTTVKNIDDITTGNITKASSSSCWQSGLSSPTSVFKHGCQSPKLARLHQQVTQFKLLKLAQNQATSTGRTRSPLRTSLRSLQAVRNSRSLETDDCCPANQTVHPPSGESFTRLGSSNWSPSPSAASMNPSGFLRSVRDSSVRTEAIKRLHRSQSLSPCRIPHAAKGYLSLHGRVYASPERSASVAWARNAPSTQK